MGQLLPRPNPPANAPRSSSSNVVPPLTLLPLTLLYNTQTVDSNLDGKTKAPSMPAQHVITAHLMRCWPSHQYVLGTISLTHGKQTLGLQSSQRFKACPTDPDDTIFGLHFPAPATDCQIQADPSFKEKAWHLTWMPLAFLASLRPQRQPTRFTGDIWVNVFLSSARSAYFTSACSRCRTHAMCLPEICARSVRESRAHL